MNIKNIVATMAMLGFVSGSVFAATDTTTSTTTTTTDTSMSSGNGGSATTTVTTKHKRHRKAMKHHAMASAPVASYKDMGALPVQPVACTISQDQMIMDATTQSLGRSMPNPCNPGWYNRIQLSGGINVDLGKFGNRNMNFMGENYQRFSLNDAYLNLGATVNDWTKAFASISYNTATINDPALVGVSAATSTAGTSHVGEYSAAYSNNVVSGSMSTLQLEQAYATFGNFDQSPLYLQLGKQFQDFSRYEIHPITRSLTQVMSETLATSIKLGFIANGFNGSVYSFDDPLAKVGQTTRTTNYGAALGFEMPSDCFGWDIGAAYLYNMIGAQDVAYNVNQFNIANTTTSPAQMVGYNNRVGATAVYGDINSGPFAVGARYTTALQRFNVLDLPKNGVSGVDGAGAPLAGQTGAKPWAAGIQAGYGFDAWGKDQNIYLGYQTSREAAGLLLPKNRYVVGYGVEMFGKNTNVGFEWDHDMAYNTANGGNGNNSNLVSLRSSVSFG